MTRTYQKKLKSLILIWKLLHKSISRNWNCIASACRSIWAKRISRFLRQFKTLQWPLQPVVVFCSCPKYNRNSRKLYKLKARPYSMCVQFHFVSTSALCFMNQTIKAYDLKGVCILLKIFENRILSHFSSKIFNILISRWYCADSGLIKMVQFIGLIGTSNKLGRQFMTQNSC